MTDLSIAPAERADIAALAAIWHEGWHVGHAAIVPPELVALRVPAEFEARVTAHLDQTFVARTKAGDVAGFFMLSPPELYQFYVAGTLRGKGIAASLMMAAERALAGQNAWLACSVGNARAAAFYTKSGWQKRDAETYAVETAKGLMDVQVWRFEKDLR